MRMYCEVTSFWLITLPVLLLLLALLCLLQDPGALNRDGGKGGGGEVGGERSPEGINRKGHDWSCLTNGKKPRRQPEKEEESTGRLLRQWCRQFFTRSARLVSLSLSVSHLLGNSVRPLPSPAPRPSSLHLIIIRTTQPVSLLVREPVRAADGRGTE